MTQIDKSRMNWIPEGDFNAVFLEPDKCPLCNHWITDATWTGEPLPKRALFHLILDDKECCGTLVYDLVDISREGSTRLQEICTVVNYPWPEKAIEHDEYDWHQFPIRDLLNHCSGRVVVITIADRITLALPHGALYPVVASYVRARPDLDGKQIIAALDETADT